MKISSHSWPRLILLGTLALTSWAVGPYSTPVYAEGSNDLVSSGGDRPYLEFRTASAGAIQRKTIIKVYANEGEIIELASSAVGIGNGVINYRDPNGVSGSCGAVGLIANRTEEANGTYTPCTVIVGAGQAGIWEIDFVSPDQNNGGNPPPISGTSNWSQPSGRGYVSAWDATVTTSTGTPILGRVYANYYAFNIGSNNRSLSSQFYVLTREGYRYNVDLNGLDPFGFILFANNNGYLGPDGNPIFRSLQYTGSNPGTVPNGYSFHNPNSPDTDNDVTHKLFINQPDPSLPASANSPIGSTWLYNNPISPPVPQNFGFIGIEGTPGQAGTSPLGGNFTFDSTTNSSYSITLDFNGNNIYGDGNDLTLLGSAVIGSNSVFWDGLDSNGVPLPASTTGYGAQINLYAGEVHFPLVDAENNKNGLIIRRENNPSPPTNPIPDPFTVYFDDRNSGNNGNDYSLCASGETGSSCYGTPPNPRSALSGVSSQAGAHEFRSNFGDRRGIDTWAYYPSQNVVLSSQIVIQEADLAVTKTDNLTTTVPGSNTTYEITVTNNGPSDVVGATFSDTLPPEIENVTWSCAVTSGTGDCTDAGGTGNVIATTLDLENGAVATFTVNGTVSTTVTGTITNTATITRPNDVTDPDLGNNEATDTTGINGPTVLLVKRITAINRDRSNEQLFDSSYVDHGTHSDEDNVAAWPGTPVAPTTGSGTGMVDSYLAGVTDGLAIEPGDEIEYTIYFLSNGNSAANGVKLCDRIPDYLDFVTDSFNTSPGQAPGGTPGADQGIRLGNASSDVSFTNIEDGDLGAYIASVSSGLTYCQTDLGSGAEDNGFIFVPLGVLAPTDYGFVRFRGRVR